ncbi:MAG: MBL fold metallo-hydrolase [Candidatus Heimdallarchaeota archaeon]
MKITRRVAMFIGIGVIVTAAAVATPIITISVLNYNAVNLTLLDNAGIMIETKGMRLYIDPINLPESYSEKPADVILITHSHGDHYESTSMDMIQKSDTVNIFPKIMTSAISSYDGIGLDPEDEYQVDLFDITAFYMYTLPVGIYPASHPQEDNFTSYIVNINGFSIFHAGDSKNIDEYSQLTGLIDVALLPLGPGCQTMTDMEVIDVIDVIQPDYFIPIHYGPLADENFILSYGHLLTECELVHLAYFESHRFR